METILFGFNYEEEEFNAKAIKLQSNDITIPVKFHIYNIVPMFRMFKGPIIMIPHADGQPHASSLSGSIDNFKSAAIFALYKYCVSNGISMA